MITEIFSSAPLLALGWTLLHSLWQGILVALGLAFALRFLRSSSARYAAACLALGLQTVAFLGTYAVENKPAPGSNPPSLAAAAAQPSVRPGIAPAMASPAVESSRARLDLTFALPWLAGLYVAGLAWLSLRQIGGWMALQRMRGLSEDILPVVLREAMPRLAAHLGLAGPVCLRQSREVKVPIAFGLLKPVILFPAGLLAQLSPAQLESVLLHELAHIRRHDYLVNLVQTLFETLLFFHPATWWISTRIRAERENCCDDMVVSATADEETYALALAEVARCSTTLALAASGGSLRDRIRRILGLTPVVVRRPFMIPLVLALLILLPCLIGGIRVLRSTASPSVDFSAQVEAAWKLPKDERLPAFERIIGTWVRQDGAGAIKWAEALPPNPRKKLCLETTASMRAAQASSRENSQWLGALPPGPDEEVIFKSGVYSWVFFHHGEAVKWVEALPPGERRLAAIQAAYEGWMQTDPQAAIQWLARLPDKQMAAFGIEQVSFYWAQHNLAAALEWANHQPPNGEILGAMDSIAIIWSMESAAAADEAWKWRERFPLDSARGFLNMACERAKKDFPATLKWAASLPPGQVRQWALEGVARIFAYRNDVPAGLKWAQSLPEDDQVPAFAGVAYGYGHIDGKAAGEWAANLPEGWQREWAIHEISEAWLWRKGDPAALRKWTAQLSPKERETVDAFVKSYEGWPK